MGSAIAPPPDSGLDPESVYEFVDGRYVEKPGGAYESWLGARLGQALGLFHPTTRLGRSVLHMLYLIDRTSNLQRRPAASFVSYQRWPRERRLPSDPAWDVIPDLAAEVTSTATTADAVLRTIAEYFRAGVRLVWVVYPTQSQVYVYESPVSVRIVGLGGELDGGAVLPGFRLPLAELFGDEEGDEDVIAPAPGA
jgi:Uma2 family endonuclease